MTRQPPKQSSWCLSDKNITGVLCATSAMRRRARELEPRVKRAHSRGLTRSNLTRMVKSDGQRVRQQTRCSNCMSMSPAMWFGGVWHYVSQLMHTCLPRVDVPGNALLNCRVRTSLNACVELQPSFAPSRASGLRCISPYQYCLTLAPKPHSRHDAGACLKLDLHAQECTTATTRCCRAAYSATQIRSGTAWGRTT